eukprot:CAMPEP_0194124702 /NCGR_PEP_ID=MMETSP0150-20130528/59079_1 /TAXON_ID=122233 /ORGANISM="Chaetoceros debilis, Strain MM31A-1" /LENGTH=247 /DNA_ID=CAMNT_0038818481 /DNA_START=119 /DNA_END=863 /DNA_ORIENTATION=-
MGNSQEKATMVEDNEVQARVAGNKVSENIATIGEEQAPIDLTTTDSDSDTDSDSVYESDEEEDDDELLERLLILEDSRRLKQLAVAFLHPEQPVQRDPASTARCYFDRASAPKLAVDYLHPELGVVTSDATASARCYFDRVSAPEQESVEEGEYCSLVLVDAAALKKLAVDYLHPELGVVTSDATASARCYDYLEAKTHTLIKAPKTLSGPAKNFKTLHSIVDSGIVKSVSSVQLFGLDDDQCDPSF